MRGVLMVAGVVLWIQGAVASSAAQAAPPAAARAKVALGSARAPARSWLGVYLVGRDPLISDVLPGTPAARAGLRPGDRVLRVGKTPVTTAAELIAAVGSLSPGTRIDIQVQSGTAPAELRSLVVEAMPSPSELLRRRFLGQAMDDFTLGQVGGSSVSLADLRGEVVVTLHFAPGCRDCDGVLPTLAELADRGAVVLMLSSEPVDALSDYVRAQAPPFPVLEDSLGRVERRYDARQLPIVVVVDRQGIIRDIGAGGEPKELDRAFDAAARALRERAPSARL